MITLADDVIVHAKSFEAAKIGFPISPTIPDWVKSPYSE